MTVLSLDWEFLCLEKWPVYWNRAQVSPEHGKWLIDIRRQSHWKYIWVTYRCMVLDLSSKDGWGLLRNNDSTMPPFMPPPCMQCGYVNMLRLRQDGCHFPDDIFKCIFLNENVWISIKISLKFVPKGPINNIPALVQIIAWRWPRDKPLSEPMMT